MINDEIMDTIDVSSFSDPEQLEDIKSDLENYEFNFERIRFTFLCKDFTKIRQL